MPWHPNHAKFGIQTMYGVKKPVYRAFQMISDALAAAAVPVVPEGGGQLYKNLAGAVVGASVGTVDVLVAVSGSTVTALLGNFNVTTGTGPLPSDNTVTLTFSGLAAPLPTSATLEFIDASHANPMAMWEVAGSPLYPRAAEIASEAAASTLVASPLALTAAGADAVTAVVTLEPFAVARIRFTAA